MPLWEGFVGGAYRARSQSIAADDCVNLFPEITEISQETKHGTLYGTPGLKFLMTVGTLKCRGNFSQDGLTLSVVGQTLYVLDVSNGLSTAKGTITNDFLPVYFASNGRGGEQIAICGGGHLYIYDLTTGVLSAPVALPLTNIPVMVDFIDGYFVLSEADSIRVWFSNLEDGTVWDALDFFAVSVTSSNVVGIKVLRNRIWVLQSQSGVVYFDSGDADNPFIPYPGSTFQEGAVNAASITVVGESIYWVSQDNQGRNRMVSATDYAPKVISWPSISFALASYSTINDCEVMAYEQEGHPFVIWTFPSAPLGTSWAWDLREEQWHRRQGWDQDAGADVRWRARGLCSSGTALVVGDYETGDLYTLDMDTATDNGAMRRWMRRAPYLAAENQWIFVDRVELGMQPGEGTATGQGSDPNVMLTLSRDGAQTWGAAVFGTIGRGGQYLARAIWRKLGRARVDRLVVEISQTDPVRPVWGPGLWLKARPGSGEL